MSDHFPELGFGLGLRIPHYAHIFEHKPRVDWFEIISENFMDTDGRPTRNLARIREHYPVVMHGIAMSIGTVDPLNSDYLLKLKKLADWLKPAWISDHLCWTGVAHKNSHDLLPVPYTEEALKHIVSRIKQVQDVLERPLVLENPSTYLEFTSSHIPEAEFIARMAQESGCHLLLDVNNVYVSCFNHRLDPKAYLDTLPLERVAQIHLSGHSNMGTHIIDTHDDHVVDEVWALYQYVVHKAGRTPNTMVEWDDNIPEWDVLFAELEKAQRFAAQADDNIVLPQLANDDAPMIANHAVTLLDAQARMQDAILLGAGIDSQPEQWIRPKADFAPRDQLAVYVNAYRYRLYDVTAEEYPVLKHYLGEEAFDHLLKDFVNSITSEHFNIGHYCWLLPEFLRTHHLFGAPALDLCLLEETLSKLADAKETVPLEPAHLEGMTPETLMESVLHPRAALQLMEFRFPVNDYFRAVKEESALPSMDASPCYLAIFRHEDVVWRMELGRDEYLLLQTLFSGVSVGEALSQVQASAGVEEDHFVMHLGEWFSRWMRNGLLAHPELKTETAIRNAA